MTLALIRLQFRIISRDPWFLVVMFGMPLAVMPIFRETMSLSLAASGFAGATGAEQVVPGQTIVFGTFVAGSVSFAVFREHGWRTWDRLRASAVTPRQLLTGFGTPWIFIHIIYQLVLFGVGFAFIDLRLNGGSLVAMTLVIVSFSCCLIALVLLATSTLRTVNQVSVLTNLGAMVMSGIGGAFVPREQLPGWAQAIAPGTPAYWAMEGHRAVFLQQGGVGDVAVPVAVLMSTAIVVAWLASMRFRVDDTKEFFA